MKVKSILKSGYFADSRHATNYIAYLDRQSPIFDQNGTEVSALEAQVNVERPSNSTVWHHVFSLRENDCERLGIDRDYMKDLVVLKASELAKAYNISPQNLRMVCSWHNKDFHPHLHFLVWSTDSREAFIPHAKDTECARPLNKATRIVKSCLTNEIFRGDLGHLMEEKSAQRDRLNEQLRRLVSSEYLVDREISDDLKALGKTLRGTRGKHTYKFLPPECKAQVDNVLEKVVQRDPILRSMYQDYLDAQKELVLTYASNEETLSEKFSAIETSFFHPYCDFDERRRGRAEVTRHNIIIQAAERYVAPAVQRKNTSNHKPAELSTLQPQSPESPSPLSQREETVPGSDYQEKSPGYAVQNMLFRLAKTLQADQQQAYTKNRAVRAANGLTHEKQNVRKVRTGPNGEQDVSTLEY